MAAGASARVLLVTAPDEAAAREIARALVEERLAACVNLIPIRASIYRWEGKLVEEGECLMIIKSTAARLEALAKRIIALHPYSVPEIISVPVERGSAPYLAWIAQSVRA
ncbi:MAG: divalent-cation tolerance protein CutA [bacterium]